MKILQARLQQSVNWKLPNVQAKFRKGRGTRDQIANILWIIEKAREFQKNIYFCFMIMLKLLTGEGNGTPLQYFCHGKSHGRRSLVGWSPWGHEESDTTEQIYFHFSFSCTGEGYGNPLQCSCLENPRDGGGWWTVCRLWGRRVGHDWSDLAVAAEISSRKLEILKEHFMQRWAQ